MPAALLSYYACFFGEVGFGRLLLLFCGGGGGRRLKGQLGVGLLQLPESLEDVFRIEVVLVGLVLHFLLKTLHQNYMRQTNRVNNIRKHPLLPNPDFHPNFLTSPLLQLTPTQRYYQIPSPNNNTMQNNKKPTNNRKLKLTK